MTSQALLTADSRGVVEEKPAFLPLAQNGARVREPEPDELMPLPEGAHLYLLPERYPLAMRGKKKVKARGLPVAAILPQGYTRTLLPAYGPQDGVAWLPYFGYTACLVQNGKLYVAALPTQPDPNWDPKSFPDKTLRSRVKKRLTGEPENRLLGQLARCALEYRCYTAANIFFERWEGALPVSPSCNAVCRGCISKAEDPGPPSPQERLEFVPSLEECRSVIRRHGTRAPQPIVSFGQGCEGEPSLQADLIERLLKELAPEFPHVQFHMNTNGSRPRAMERLYKAGLNSIRVSLNAAHTRWYDAYYRPKHYAFRDLCETIRITRHYGIFVSLNLLCFPGVTDHPREIEAFFRFLSDFHPDLVQLRNLNIDPWAYLKECIREPVSGIGIPRWLSLLRREFPAIKIGNFTPYVKVS